MSKEIEMLKCVVVGDGTVGKTCLLIRYAKDEFPSDYIPTIFDSYTVSLLVGGDTFKLSLFDTAGQENYDQLRKLAFVDTDILLVCFAIDARNSLENVRHLWVSEIKEYCPGVPFILVGTKSDLRNAQQTGGIIPKAQGVRLANELGAVKYLECSAFTKENVHDVFQEAIVTALSDNSRPTSVRASGNAGASTSASVPNANNNRATQENEDTSCCSCVVL